MALWLRYAYLEQEIMEDWFVLCAFLRFFLGQEIMEDWLVLRAFLGHFLRQEIMGEGIVGGLFTLKLLVGFLAFAYKFTLPVYFLAKLPPFTCHKPHLSKTPHCNTIINLPTHTPWRHQPPCLACQLNCSTKYQISSATAHILPSHLLAGSSTLNLILVDDYPLPRLKARPTSWKTFWKWSSGQSRTLRTPRSMYIWSTLWPAESVLNSAAAPSFAPIFEVLYGLQNLS
ncbi:hypothetical protein V498_00023 [Pseudogymnoascus sp. VKM F-4517 (FW-2822)]|nr:hypothetical protein V498_00023 [Pseudogymnoascus sp. VKM F-4517 (FW-2822)]